MDIKKILNMDQPEKSKVLMILSNAIDMGYEKGGLISFKSFDKLANDLITWKYHNNIDNTEASEKLVKKLENINNFKEVVK